jgi:methionyl-tRNA formyltransferase
MRVFDSDIELYLGPVIIKILDGTLKPRLQDDDLATWVPRRNLGDCLINFNSTIIDLERFFLALVEPYPLPAFLYKCERFEVLEHKLIPRNYYCTAGRVVNIREKMAFIKVKNGLLVIGRVRDKDGTILDAGNLLPMGARLNV